MSEIYKYKRQVDAESMYSEYPVTTKVFIINCKMGYTENPLYTNNLYTGMKINICI